MTPRNHIISVCAGDIQSLAPSARRLPRFVMEIARESHTCGSEPFRQAWRYAVSVSRILIAHARAHSSGKHVPISTPGLPPGKNFAIFDIEGLPPHLDELDKIYLWGIQVFGQTPGPYLVAFTNFGHNGDRQGWLDFLKNCKRVFDLYGDLPFLHWSAYERTYLRKYIQRHGNPEGVAARVEQNLVDLFPIVKNAVVLPSPSYSLKVVEKHAGFKRKLDDANGQWAMATYIRAVETEDVEECDKLKEQIIEYNKEDLAGTWAVFEWLRSLP